ncbi:MAG: flagellin [Deltaproteobacteria bacterium]
MSLIINTNIASLVAQQNLAVTNSQLKVSVQRLSSGYRVNSSADDAAGMARADQLRSQTRMIQAAMRNVNDAMSSLEVSDKAAEQITNLLTRMGELAASASQGTLDSSTRAYYRDEYDKLISEIDRIAATTEFGGSKLLNGTVASLTMFIGFKNSSSDSMVVSLATLISGATTAVKHKIRSVVEVADLSTVGFTSQVVSIALAGTSLGTFSVGSNSDVSTWAAFINNIDANASINAWSEYDADTGQYRIVIESNASGASNVISILGDGTPLTLATASNITTLATGADAGGAGLGLVSSALSTQAGAQAALDTISAALKVINDARAIYGASSNRLSAALSNLQVTFTNFQSAESRIRDADFAYETAQYTRNQIMVQAGTSVLAQANTLPQQALTLLR